MRVLAVAALVAALLLPLASAGALFLPSEGASASSSVRAQFLKSFASTKGAAKVGVGNPAFATAVRPLAGLAARLAASLPSNGVNGLP